MLKIWRNDNNLKTTCIHCKKPMPIKYSSKRVGKGRGIKEVVSIGCHESCAKRLLELEWLEYQIEEQNMVLTTLRHRYATLKTEEITDSTQN